MPFQRIGQESLEEREGDGFPCSVVRERLRFVQREGGFVEAACPGQEEEGSDPARPRFHGVRFRTRRRHVRTEDAHGHPFVAEGEGLWRIGADGASDERAGGRAGHGGRRNAWETGEARACGEAEQTEKKGALLRQSGSEMRGNAERITLLEGDFEQVRLFFI